MSLSKKSVVLFAFLGIALILSGCTSTPPVVDSSQNQSNADSGNGGSMMDTGSDSGNTGDSMMGGDSMMDGSNFDNMPHMTQTYTLEEVALHSTAQDCWMVLSGKVYDVTDYVSSHPGGQAIVYGCGKDGTSMYENRANGSGPHSEEARALAENFYIGDLA